MARPTSKKARKAAITDTGTAPTTGRLYQKLARKLFQELAAGKYAVGDRLPAALMCAGCRVSMTVQVSTSPRSS